MTFVTETFLSSNSDFTYNSIRQWTTKLEQSSEKKSRIREVKHLSTDADISTDAIRGCTKNSPKPDFFEKREKSSKMQKLKNV